MAKKAPTKARKSTTTKVVGVKAPPKPRKPRKPKHVNIWSGRKVKPYEWWKYPMIDSRFGYPPEKKSRARKVVQREVTA